jgi:hypothetical protein
VTGAPLALGVRQIRREDDRTADSAFVPVAEAFSKRLASLNSRVAVERVETVRADPSGASLNRVFRFGHSAAVLVCNAGRSR